MEIAKRGEGPAGVPRVGEEGRRRGAPSLRGAMVVILRWRSA